MASPAPRRGGGRPPAPSINVRGRDVAAPARVSSVEANAAARIRPVVCRVQTARPRSLVSLHTLDSLQDPARSSLPISGEWDEFDTGKRAMSLVYLFTLSPPPPPNNHPLPGPSLEAAVVRWRPSTRLDDWEPGPRRRATPFAAHRAPYRLHRPSAGCQVHIRGRPGAMYEYEGDSCGRPHVGNCARHGRPGPRWEHRDSRTRDAAPPHGMAWLAQTPVRARCGGRGAG
ncbi:hypothetical protein LZ30DRAFT_366212 [Colletotrichum cereale]|nr:hypothetical protein LZ30DRAFT_366212 [Colletotrichum cereale]